jgi:hypothetical protein
MSYKQKVRIELAQASQSESSEIMDRRKELEILIGASHRHQNDSVDLGQI